MIVTRLLVLVLALALALPALAQSSRSRRNEFYGGPVFTDGKDYSFQGGSTAKTDTGYGLTLEDQRHLFTKYGRFHRDRGIPGTGLGLYISKAIVEAHGGHIDVESAPGRGSVFTVRLPGDTGPAS